ncbi:MAG: hypothetical protein ACRCR5_09220 [Lactococcus garvieae]
MERYVVCLEFACGKGTLKITINNPSYDLVGSDVKGAMDVMFASGALAKPATKTTEEIAATKVSKAYTITQTVQEVTLA